MHATEYTVDQVEAVMTDKVDWTEAYRTYVFGDYGDYVNIMDDGRLVVHGTGTHYRDPDAAGVIYGFRCSGFGNLDTTHFTDSFVAWDDDIEAYREFGSGRVVGQIEDVAEECIQDGDYSDWIEDHIQFAREQHAERLAST